MKRRTLKSGLIAAAAALLAGCSSFAPDGGFDAVRSASSPHLKTAPVWARSEAEQQAAEQRRQALLSAGPLQADAAVELALIANPGLQASYQQLAVAEAERVQAGRIANPGLSFGRSTQGDEREQALGLHLGLNSLLTLPLRQQLAERQLASTQAQTAQAVLSLAADTRRAWIQAVAAQELLRYRADVLEAAEAGAELAQRMAAVGNFNRLQRAREQGFLAEAQLARAQAHQARDAAREQLIRLLGLWGEEAANLRLPERLPELPAAAREQPDVEQLAIAQRLDVQAARLQLEGAARQLGLARVEHFGEGLGLELGRTKSRSHPQEPAEREWAIEFRLPLFDDGAARTARARALWQQTQWQARQTAINARSEVREAYGRYQLAWQMARHQQQVLLPLAREISEENLLRYNGMLIGVFELLADARAQVGASSNAMTALRDFWLAQAALDEALVGSPRPLSLSVSTAPTAAAGDAH